MEYDSDDAWNRVPLHTLAEWDQTFATASEQIHDILLKINVLMDQIDHDKVRATIITGEFLKQWFFSSDIQELHRVAVGLLSVALVEFSELKHKN